MVVQREPNNFQVILYNSMIKFCYIPSPLLPLILLKSDFPCTFVTFILSPIIINNTSIDY